MISSTQTNQPFSPTRESINEEFLERALAALKQAGHRITQARVQLLKQLGAAEVPLSVEELHAAVGRHSCDVVTIYRCMLVFEDHNLVRRSFRFNGTTVFERKLDSPTRYRVQSKVDDRQAIIDSGATAALERELQRLEIWLHTQGYTGVSHSLQFFAYPKREDVLGDRSGGSHKAPITLLVVDDNYEYRGMLKTVLESRGHPVLVAPSGRAALQILEYSSVDAILTDLDMEDVNGLELCQAVKMHSDPRIRDLPVWIMTGSRDAESVPKPAKVGAAGVLQKPFDIAQACARICKSAQV